MCVCEEEKERKESLSEAAESCMVGRGRRERRMVNAAHSHIATSFALTFECSNFARRSEAMP